MIRSSLLNKNYVFDKIYSILQNIIDLLAINDDLLHFLCNPFLILKKKCFFLYIIFHLEKISSKIIRLIKLISPKKSYTICVSKTLAHKKKWVKIYIATAIPLSSFLEEYLIEEIKKNNKNKKFFLEKKVNKSILGGLIIRFKNKEWDNSLKETIRKLKIYFL